MLENNTSAGVKLGEKYPNIQEIYDQFKGPRDDMIQIAGAADQPNDLTNFKLTPPPQVSNFGFNTIEAAKAVEKLPAESEAINLGAFEHDVTATSIVPPEDLEAKPSQSSDYPKNVGLFPYVNPKGEVLDQKAI